MGHYLRRGRGGLLVLILILILAVVPLLSACSAPGKGTKTTKTATSTVDPNTPGKPLTPPPFTLTDPKKAVLTYVFWITYAYRVGNSDIATPAFTPYEEVRVNSYVQYNIQQGRAIDQTPTLFDIKSVQVAENTATVSAHEEWLYRYISLETGKYNSPQYKVSYDTTYIVVKGADGKWRVHKVTAKPQGDVK